MELPLWMLAAAVTLLALVLWARRGQISVDRGSQPGSDSQDTVAIHSRLDQAMSALGAISGALEQRRLFEERSLDAVEAIQRLVVGSYSRGRVGENLLEAALAELPAEMVARDFTLGGRVCEFALRMDDGKLLPVDSKWAAAELMQEIQGATDMNRREDVRRRIEAVVSRRVREVAGYINPSLTVPMAVLAVPDPVYACCRKVHSTARGLRVTLVGYSQALPMLLSVANLYRAYGRQIDTERLTECMHELTVCLGELGDRLEGHLSRGLKQASNAVEEMRVLISKASATVSGISVGPHATASEEQFDFRAQAV